MRIFSDICGDNNPIHLDPIEAKNSIFGGTIVHGENECGFTYYVFLSVLTYIFYFFTLHIWGDYYTW